MIEAATLWHLIEARAEATPRQRMAVDPTGRELDFGGYRDVVLETARGLHAQGIGSGSTVAWMLPTRMETMILVGALSRLDAIQIPILPIFRAREVRFIAGQCRPDLLVTPPVWRGFDYPAMAREVAEEQDGLGTFVLDRELPTSPEIELPPRRRLWTRKPCPSAGSSIRRAPPPIRRASNTLMRHSGRPPRP